MVTKEAVFVLSASAVRMSRKNSLVRFTELILFARKNLLSSGFYPPQNRQKERKE